MKAKVNGSVVAAATTIAVGGDAPSASRMTLMGTGSESATPLSSCSQVCAR